MPSGVIGLVRPAVSGLALLLIAGCASVPPPITESQYDELGAVEAFYGKEARQRVQTWRQLQQTNRNQPVATQLAVTNAFFNRLVFEDDLTHWQAEDYWATPLETIATNGGDCEDFATGKYFTLTALGIPERCLKLVYVKALRPNQAHMVLSYQCTPQEAPLILDNLVTAILPASARTDLVPVYSFNTNGFWLTPQQGRHTPLHNAPRLSRWTQLLQRIDQPLKP